MKERNQKKKINKKYRFCGSGTGQHFHMLIIVFFSPSLFRFAFYSNFVDHLLLVLWPSTIHSMWLVVKYRLRAVNSLARKNPSKKFIFAFQYLLVLSRFMGILGRILIGHDGDSIYTVRKHEPHTVITYFWKYCDKFFQFSFEILLSH